MKKIAYSSIVLLLIITAACIKETKVITPTIPAKQWEKYIGTYDVYDTIAHTQWVMNIKFISHGECKVDCVNS